MNQVFEINEMTVPGAQMQEQARAAWIVANGRYCKPPSFEEVAAPHLRSLSRGAWRLTGDDEVANDLMQDTLEHAYRSFERFQPGSNCRAWLFRIMRNLWISQHRYESVRPRLVALEEMVGSAESALQPSSWHDLAESVIDEMSVETIRAAIENLPAELREVIILSTLHDLSYENIAETLAIPKGTVCSRLFRGRRRLKAVLAEQARDMGYLGEAA